MLTIEECRKHLRDDRDLTDEQVLELRDALYHLIETVWDEKLGDKSD